MEIFASIITHPDGNVDVEFLDSEPTDSFTEELLDNAPAGTRVQVRRDFLNGGDSEVLEDFEVPA